MTLSIGIVTPSYNQGQFIATTIWSVLNQNYANLQYIVVDGASTDETVAILQGIEHPNFSFISEPDQGQTDAINKGMRQLTALDIVAYLNSDDVYQPRTLQAVAAFFEEHPDVDVVYGDCAVIDSQGHTLDMSLNGKAYDPYLVLSARHMNAQPATFWRQRIAKQVGEFDTSLNYVLDYDYWLRLIEAGARFQYVPQLWASFRLHDNSKTVSQIDRFVAERQTALKRFFSKLDEQSPLKHYEHNAYAYATYAGVQQMLQAGMKQEVRPLLRSILQSACPARLKILAALTYIDTWLGTSIHVYASNVYRRLKERD